MKNFDVITIFPEMFNAVSRYGITGRARENGLYQIVTWNPRDFSDNRHRQVDDRPYGGGPGMVMSFEPIRKAFARARARQMSCGVRRSLAVYLSPQGRKLDQKLIEELETEDGIIMLAGRYEGVDERILESEIDLEISIGDYILSGGEIPAMVMVDALVRRIPSATNDRESVTKESFANGYLDYPQYTRPECEAGRRVPKALISGDHSKIARWRQKEALGRTWQRRPDLLDNVQLDEREVTLLEEYKLEIDKKLEEGENNEHN